LVDFALAFAVLAAMLAWSGIAPGAAVIWLPVFTLLAIAAALGVALWLAAVNALFRDVRLALPFAVQLWMLVSPVVYAAPNVLEGRPGWVALVYSLNPMAGVIAGFRWSLLGLADPPLVLLAGSVLSTLLLLTSGLLIFRRLERSFADRV
jgi:lipopolysaccharide transport system permease protein